MKKRLKMTTFLLLASVTITFGQQVGIGTENPDATAILELDVSDYAANNKKGFLPPRMTTAQRDAIASPAEGLTIYNTSVKCIEFHNGSFESGSPVWINTCEEVVPVGTITNLNCGSAVFSPSTLVRGASYSGTLSVPYTGGNSGTYAAQSFTVNGLTFTLPAGSFTPATGNIVYNVSGTPAASGSMTVPVSIGGRNCNVTKVVDAPAVVGGLSCSSPTLNGTLTLGVNASGVSTRISYTGGNGQTYPSQVISSTGVTGLTATLNSGTLVNGSGNITFNITGKPLGMGTGTANFTFTFGGQTCTFSRKIQALCKHIKDLNPSATTGVYSLDIDGDGSYGTMNGQCDMTTDGGGWTLVSNYTTNGSYTIPLESTRTSLPTLGPNAENIGSGIDELNHANYWGQVNQSIINAMPFTNIRWRAKGGHDGTLTHLKTTNAANITALKNHTSLGGNATFSPYADNTLNYNTWNQNSNYPMVIGKVQGVVLGHNCGLPGTGAELFHVFGRSNVDSFGMGINSYYVACGNNWYIRNYPSFIRTWVR